MSSVRKDVNLRNRVVAVLLERILLWNDLKNGMTHLIWNDLRKIVIVTNENVLVQNSEDRIIPGPEPNVSFPKNEN